MLLTFTAGCQRVNVGSGDQPVQAKQREDRGTVDTFPDPWKIPPLISKVDTLLSCGRGRIEIRAALSADKKSGHSGYHYVVINKPDGTGAIMEFALENVAKEPIRWEAPEPWIGAYVRTGGSGRFSWSLPDSAFKFAIQPGDTLFEFTLVSVDPPGPLRYNATVCATGLEGGRMGNATGIISGPSDKKRAPYTPWSPP
jgi:hypothetical protein